ncbi:MAG: glutamate--cysteine ligase [Methanobrevibacter sp.]|uniref:glutamate--cysteine ligase n=1 Tax=uncultured Methanobrevibacter sp. TaxID=253161 RepID=UPI0025E4F577|nr:glutamate--cysteine ligase [uncultured Methanobrevibacter sp.]MEE1128786.1 glutamate--cysteine ligase [Methanobrevibacter sp.]
MELKNLSRLSSDEILEGSFGIEWESLRAKDDGKLSLSPHPAIFGDKLTNPLITTDFSESQIEIITPTFPTVDEAFDTFSLLSDLVNASLPDDEYLWFQSIPCILPYWDQIPIAQYSDDGIDSQKYREDLAKKYGVKKQMISGVHFNFSFSEEFLKKLYSFENDKMSFKEFKDNVYLKIARNYLRYCWLIIYLTGCSIGSHKSFSHDCIHLMDAQDDFGSYYSTKGPSFRNASCGYKNLKELYPSYNSVSEFVDDINKFIEDGDLSEAKELYTQIRLKPKDPKNLLNSLNNDGIEYIEIRTLDINPFYKCGLVKRDMKFLHLFLIYMLIKDESDYKFWQREAKINEENVAERAYDVSMRLLKDGTEITIKKWAYELINEMFEMCDVLNIYEFDTLNIMLKRILNPNLTYGKKLLKLIKDNGYINTHLNLSMDNKKISVKNLENIDLYSNPLKKYVNIALMGK